MPAPAPHVSDLVEAISIRYNNQVYEMKARGEDVIVLSLGEAFFDIPLFGFDGLPMPDGHHYSHSRGVPGLRSRLAAYYASNYGVPVDADREILITAGPKIAIPHVAHGHHQPRRRGAGAGAGVGELQASRSSSATACP